MREFRLFCLSAGAFVVLAAASQWQLAHETSDADVSRIMRACSRELDQDSARAGPFDYRRAFWRAQMPHWLQGSPETLLRHARGRATLRHEAVQACIARTVLGMRSARNS